MNILFRVGCGILAASFTYEAIINVCDICRLVRLNHKLKAMLKKCKELEEEI